MSSREGRKRITFLGFVIILVVAMVCSSVMTFFITYGFSNKNVTGTITLEESLKGFYDKTVYLEQKDVLDRLNNAKKEMSQYEKIYSKVEGENPINAYIHSLETNNKLNLSDDRVYLNTINGRTSVSDTDLDIGSNILISKKTKLKDAMFDEIRKESCLISGLSSSQTIYPGSLINIENKIATGYASEVIVDRKGAKFTVKSDKKQSEFEEKELTRENILDDIYDEIDENDFPYEIVVAKATSPEQLACELGISVNDAQRFLYNYWQDIFNGKKQVVVAAAKQIVCSVSTANDYGSNPSELFADDVNLDEIQSLINNDNEAAYVKNVQYGNVYLLSGMINNDTTYNTQSQNGFVDVVDLQGAFITFLRSGQEKLTDEQKNGLKYAKVETSHIGKDSTEWTPITQVQLSDFIKTISDSTKFTKSDELVPVSFEAFTLGKNHEKVVINTDAAKFEICCVEGVRSGDFWCHENAKGVATQNESKTSWGIDLAQFNSNNSIVEKKYIEENNNSSSRSRDKVAAFQCVFGMSVNAEALSCTCRGYNKDRFVQGAIYKGSCGGGGLRNNGVVTGPVDLRKGVYAYTKDWSRDCYCFVNGVEYGAVRGKGNGGSNVSVERLWEENLNGNSLKYRNDSARDIEELVKGR